METKPSLAKSAAASVLKPDWKLKLAEVREKVAAAKSARDALEAVSGQKLGSMLRRQRKQMPTKTQAGYVEQSQRPGQTCSVCEYYLGNGRCQKVAGLLSDGGWCPQFQQKEQGPANEVAKTRPHLPEIERGGGVTTQG